MKEKTKPTIAVVLGTILLFTPSIYAQRYMENLGRGVVAIPTDSSHVYVGWRMLGTDPNDIAFNLYRSTGGGAAVKRNTSLITQSTNYVDSSVNLTLTNSYFVRPVLDGQEGAASKPFTLPAGAPVRQYILIPTQLPAGGTTPDGNSYTYTANDCSVGDLDGDGEYEIVLKWDPSNSKDNGDPGYTGNVFLDAYEPNGTRLWRIDLGINIRAGAHYTQFMVYDLDSDGKAEVACKTAPGTKDGLGRNVILPGDDPNADYRSTTGDTKGKILSGPEYLTIFDGLTGAELVTTDYIPPRGTPSSWGDSIGNRVDRFLACVAYLDGVRPSLVMCRGYYTRTALAAWDWRNGQLTQRWVFDTGFSGGPWSAWKGQGNHNLSVGDVDGDGKDEIVYGACAIDDDGTGLYTTGLGHGDAMHLSDMDPDRPGLEVWDIHENPPHPYGVEFRDAATGGLIWGAAPYTDVSRGLAAHIDSGYRGFQFWSSGRSGVYDVTNTQISTFTPSINFAAWWDADLQRELVDKAGYDGDPKLDKWTGNGVTRLLSFYMYPTAYGCDSINSTKGNPCLSGDIWGDWREEVIYRLTDNTGLIVFNTTTLATNRFYTFIHDPQYRLSIAWQNVAYNQPPHTSFYVGVDMQEPPHPDIRVLYGDFTGNNIVDIEDLSEFTKSWLVTDCNNIEMDWNDDCIINFYEFSLLARNWLKGTP